MVLDTLIPISQFNKGQAAKIFDEDYNLLVEANTRLLSNQKLHSEDEVMKKFNITQEELDEMEDVEIE